MKGSPFTFDAPARSADRSTPPRPEASAAPLQAAPRDRDDEEDSTQRTPEEPGYGHGV